MPPASGRSAATAGGTGATKDATTKKVAHIKASRKSIATDPALLQGSSDEEGEGPQDHEENHGSQRAAQRANYIQRAAQKTSARSAAAARLVEPVNSNSSPRRSTRLSGEGLGMQDQASTATSGGNTTKQPSRSKDQVSSTSLSQSTIPNKRKAPASTKTTNVVGSTHLTPPETDSDNGQGSKSLASQRQASSQSRSPTTKSKRLREASGAARPNTQKVPSPPASDRSDESDNFAFTRVDPAASSSKLAISESASQPLPSRSSHSAQSDFTSQSQPVGRSNTATKQKKGAQLTSLDLLQTIKEAKQNGKKRTMSTETSTRDAETVVDRKGKRKADESAGEEQDGSADALPEGSTERVKSSQASKSKSTKARLKKGRVADLRREEEDDSQLSNQPPDPGTPARSSRAIPINTQETPAIQRNLAMRAGLGHGAPPGTPGSARRTSSDMRGRRGSSIGNGMEALPHPSLPSNTLYRHIKADDPPAVRFRTLVAWSAHRVKDKAEAESSNASSAVRAAASSVMDSLISDLMEKRIDLGWQAVDPANDASTKKLPPNKENESNETKLAACQAWIKRLQEEDQARNARINQYKTMTERITKLTTPLPAPVPSPSDPSQMIMPDLLQPNWSLPLPRFTNKADILAYGKTLMQSKPIAISSRSTRRKSAAAAEAPSDSNTVNIQDEYPVDYDEIRHQAASLAQSSYRVNQFVKLADTFITQHLQRTQASLAQIRSGNDNRASALTSGSNEKGKNTTTTANDVNSTTQALLASAKGDARTGGAEGRKKGKDAMSLLRAISRADTGKKR